MSRSCCALLASAGVLFLAACADNANTVAPASSVSVIDPFESISTDPQPMRLGAVPTMQAAQARAAATPTGSTLVEAGINYHGGAVMLAYTRIAAVYWSGSKIYTGEPPLGTSGGKLRDSSNVGYFLAHLNRSPYFHINTSYTNGAGVAIADSVIYGQYWTNNSYRVPAPLASVTDSQMVDMLQYAFDNGKLKYNVHTLYTIFTGGVVNLGGGFGTQYCAYHSWGYVTIAGVTKRVLYAAMPHDWGKSSVCAASELATFGSPNNDPDADAEVSTLVHEIEETTTDPMGQGWWESATGEENADKCAWTFGTELTASNGAKYNVTLGTKNFLIQRNWRNVSPGSCGLTL